MFDCVRTAPRTFQTRVTQGGPVKNMITVLFALLIVLAFTFTSIAATQTPQKVEKKQTNEQVKSKNVKVKSEKNATTKLNKTNKAFDPPEPPPTPPDGPAKSKKVIK